MTPPTVTPRTLAAVTLLLSLFATLALIAHHAATGTTLDHAVLDWMVHHRDPTLTAWAIGVTEAGSPAGVGALTLVLSAVLWLLLRRPGLALVLVGAVGAAGILSTATKVIVGAHRPPLGLQLIAETDPSFPSGHVTGTVALLGALTAVIGHHGRPAVRVLLVAVTAAGAGAVAFTRLYLGVHWVSDVVGGLLLGSIAAIAAHQIYQSVAGPGGGGTRTGAPAVPAPGRTVGARRR